MPYPGLTFAFMVGVAVCTAIYYIYNQNQQTPYQYDNSRNNYSTDTSSQSQCSSYSNSQRRKRRDSNSYCTICHDDCREDKNTEILKCGHKFHNICITNWFKHVTRRSCPNCRQFV